MNENVLLVIVPGYDAPRANAYALDNAAQRRGKLVVAAVLDPTAHRNIAKTLSEVGFVGDRVSDDVLDALDRERRGFAEAQVARIAEEAGGRGIECAVRVEEGDPSDVCARLVRECGVGIAVLVVEKRSWVTRFLSRSAPVRLPTFAGCEIKVMED